MKIYKRHNNILILNSHQTKLCQQFAGINRLIYNLALQQRSLAYRLCKKSLSNYDQSKELPGLKDAFPFIKEAPAQTLQQSLLDLQDAFNRFLKNKGSVNYPLFKKKSRDNSFRFSDPKQFKIKRLSKRKAQITLHKLGKCKFWYDKDNPIIGKPKSATVKKEAGQWYISILCEVDLPEPIQIKPETAGSAVGIDRGCNNLIATSSHIFGEKSTKQYQHLKKITNIKSPSLLDLRKEIILKYELRIKDYQRILALKKKKSRAFYKTKSKITKLHRKLSNYRKDALHQISKYIVESQDIICLEDLNVKAMTKSNKGTKENPGQDVAKKSGLNKAVLSQGWGYLRTFIQYKSEWSGKLCFDKVPPAYTSQQCYLCKFKDEKNREGENFKCQSCGHQDHADVNAAKNILRAGLARIASKSDAQRLLNLCTDEIEELVAKN